jgi:signal transduction histidine kinase
MTKARSGTRWHYLMAVMWLVLSVSLATWWMIVGLSVMSERLHRMFLWEGIAFIALLVAGGLAIVAAIRREHRRRESLETFFLSFTHDLKTSLASVQLQAERLLEERPNDTARAPLDRLLYDTLRLQIQLENSLFVAQPDGRLLAERIHAREAIARLAQDWPDLTVDLKGDAEVVADARGFDAVLRNLFQNAVVHGGAHRVTVNVEPQRSSNVVRLTVADDGRGVSAEAFDTLGLPFSRSGPTSGSGMGLFVCRQIIARMNGAMRFVRPDGQEPGLTVVLDLPGGA